MAHGFVSEAGRLAAEWFVLSEWAVLLLQVFNDPIRPPDVEFGCFAALYGPKGSAYEGQALLRVDIGAGRTGRGKAMPVVVPMSRADVARYDPYMKGACLHACDNCYLSNCGSLAPAQSTFGKS